MHRLKMQIEGQLHEIVFFTSVLLAFSVFLSGLFSLALTPESLVYILGSFGSAINQALISGFGFAFFYFSVIALHAGYVINMNIFSFRDFKREHQLLSITAVAHILILFCLSALLSVFQVSLEMQNGEVLTGGLGGLVGQTFGRFLHAHLGLYGASIVLIAVAFGISVLSGFYEISDVVKFGKEVAAGTKDALVSAAKMLYKMMSHLASLLVRDQRMATANVGFTASKSWVSHSFHKANSALHERLQSGAALLKKKPVLKAKTAKKAIVKKASLKAVKTEAVKTATALKAETAKTAASKTKKKSSSKKS